MILQNSLHLRTNLQTPLKTLKNASIREHNVKILGVCSQLLFLRKETGISKGAILNDVTQIGGGMVCDFVTLRSRVKVKHQFYYDRGGRGSILGQNCVTSFMNSSLCVNSFIVLARWQFQIL